MSEQTTHLICSTGDGRGKALLALHPTVWLATARLGRLEQLAARAAFVMLVRAGDPPPPRHIEDAARFLRHVFPVVMAGHGPPPTSPLDPANPEPPLLLADILRDVPGWPPQQGAFLDLASPIITAFGEARADMPGAPQQVSLTDLARRSFVDLASQMIPPPPADLDEAQRRLAEEMQRRFDRLDAEIFGLGKNVPPTPPRRPIGEISALPPMSIAFWGQQSAAVHAYVVEVIRASWPFTWRRASALRNPVARLLRAQELGVPVGSLMTAGAILSRAGELAAYSPMPEPSAPEEKPS